MIRRGVIRSFGPDDDWDDWDNPIPIIGTGCIGDLDKATSKIGKIGFVHFPDQAAPTKRVRRKAAKPKRRKR